MLVNEDVKFMDYNYLVIYEDFENDICVALLPVQNEIRIYNRMVLVYPLDPMSNRENILGFEKFCKNNQLPHKNMGHIRVTKNYSKEKGFYYFIFYKIIESFKLFISNRY